MSLRIRVASVEDASAINWISTEVTKETPRTIPRGPHEARTIQEIIENIQAADAAGARWFVAEVDERVVGFLTAKRGARAAMRHVADLGITVARDARGRGAGRALMLACEAWAREVGVRKLTLGVFHDNQRALSLYTSLGYQQEGRRVGMFLIDGRLVDEILMAKEI